MMSGYRPIPKRPGKCRMSNTPLSLGSFISRLLCFCSWSNTNTSAVVVIMCFGLQSFQIYKNLAWLNELPADAAAATFLACCGSRKWAERMAAERPFKMLEDLYTTAEGIWFSSTPADWLEAFGAHPRIGSFANGSGRVTDRSKNERSGAAAAGNTVKEKLAEANRLYEEKFGFIFIVCATGLTAEEMLAMCVSRMSNPAEKEIRIAAREQQKITELRLNELLEK